MAIDTPEREHRIPLSNNSISPTELVVPIAAGAAVAAAGIGAALVVGQRDQGLTDAIMTVSLVAGLVSFFVVCKVRMTKPALEICGDMLALVDGRRNEVLARATVASASIIHGYGRVSSRAASGVVPAISLQLQGSRPVSISPQDLESYYYWQGDDPWTRTYNRPTNLRSPTALATGAEFVLLAKLLVKDDVLIAKPNGT